MRNLILQNLINGSKFLLKTEPFVFKQIGQTRLQSTIAFKTFATNSKLPPFEPNENFVKATELLHKKHANPYLLFVQKQYKDVAEKNPTMKSKDIFQNLGNTWKSMTFDQKIIYLDDASKQRQEKKVELATLFKTKEEADAFAQNQKDLRSKRRKELKERREKREKALLKRPKKPQSAFFLYTQTLDRGEAPVTQFVKGASQKWKALPTQDKEKYEVEAKALAEKYQKDLKEWEVKMMADGKSNLVRKSFANSVKKTLTAKETTAKKMRKIKKTKSKTKTAKKSKKQVLSEVDSKIKQLE